MRSLFARSQSESQSAPTAPVSQIGIAAAATPVAASAVTPVAVSSAATSQVAVPQAASFEEIVARYHGKVFQLIYRYTGDYEESCDLTQDTFVRAYGAWNEFRGDSQIYTWLYRIAINLCHNHQKKTQRRRQIERVSLDAPLCEEAGEHSEGLQVADERPLPLQVLESCEMRLRLQEALLELPDNYRTVIVLRDIEGLTYEEIARVTDSTLEAIKSRLFRARNAVRRLMEPYIRGPLPEAALLEEFAPVASLTGIVESRAHNSTFNA
ncbi:MAG: hypothetical protein JWN98_1568 [Abditibacteriota bacterium]|nr:hypothetical protein [Abditibacteriota bacterium]